MSFGKFIGSTFEGKTLVFRFAEGKLTLRSSLWKNLTDIRDQLTTLNESDLTEATVEAVGIVYKDKNNNSLEYKANDRYSRVNSAIKGQLIKEVILYYKKTNDTSEYTYPVDLHSSLLKEVRIV